MMVVVMVNGEAMGWDGMGVELWFWVEIVETRDEGFEMLLEG